MTGHGVAIEALGRIRAELDQEIDTCRQALNEAMDVVGECRRRIGAAEATQADIDISLAALRVLDGQALPPRPVGVSEAVRLVPRRRPDGDAA